MASDPEYSFRKLERTRGLESILVSIDSLTGCMLFVDRRCMSLLPPIVTYQR